MNRNGQTVKIQVWWFILIFFVILVVESDLLDQIKKNKVSKALFLMQKALLVYNSMEPNKNSKTKSLLEVTQTFTLF